MELLDAIYARHSVRSYTPRPIEGETLQALTDCIDQCNRESGLHIQLVLEEPRAFDSAMAHYGKFSGVRNYVALVGKKGPELQEKCGYYGEKVVLRSQQLGLNTCWVAMTYKKIPSAFRVEPGETLCCVISIGYGATQGKAHTIKSRAAVMKESEHTAPDWLLRGVDAALLAPTAVNQQKFTFSRRGDRVTARAGLGFYSKIDLGIVKYHFELAAGTGNFTWA